MEVEPEEVPTAYEGIQGEDSIEGSQESVDLSDALVSGSETEEQFTSTAVHDLSAKVKCTPIHRTRGDSSLSFASSRLLSQTRNPRQEAELIHAKSKIVHLQGEVLGLQQAAKRARIERDEKEEGENCMEQLKHLHKLEVERCDLLEQSAATKEKLTEVERELKEKTTRLDKLTATYERDKRNLTEQMTELKSTANSLLSENGYLKTQLNLLQQKVEMESTGLTEVQETYERSMEVLKARVKELEAVESKLHRAEAKAQELEHKLRQYKHDSHFVEVARSKVLHYDELERQHKMVCLENKALRDKSDNIELLRYRVQSLQECCGRQEKRLEQMEAENQRLMREGGENASLGDGGSSSLALQYRISSLQQREVVLVSQVGELETKVKLAERSLATSNEALGETRKQLAREQEDLRNKEERIQRLERRLLFVTKERDGCVNVLKSYQLDAGVDALLKENLAELRDKIWEWPGNKATTQPQKLGQQLSRAKERITELESEVDIKSRKLEELSSRETIPEVDHASLKINTKPEIIVLTDS